MQVIFRILSINSSLKIDYRYGDVLANADIDSFHNDREVLIQYNRASWAINGADNRFQKQHRYDLLIINLVFVNILKWKLYGTVKKGDIVVAENPFKPGYTIVKRVTHVEGEMAEIERNGDVQQVVIPKNHIWIEGDTSYLLEVVMTNIISYKIICINLIKNFNNFEI